MLRTNETPRFYHSGCQPFTKQHRTSAGHVIQRTAPNGDLRHLPFWLGSQGNQEEGHSKGPPVLTHTRLVPVWRACQLPASFVFARITQTNSKPSEDPEQQPALFAPTDIAKASQTKRQVQDARSDQFGSSSWNVLDECLSIGSAKDRMSSSHKPREPHPKKLTCSWDLWPRLSAETRFRSGNRPGQPKKEPSGAERISSRRIYHPILSGSKQTTEQTCQLCPHPTVRKRQPHFARQLPATRRSLPAKYVLVRSFGSASKL